MRVISILLLLMLVLPIGSQGVNRSVRIDIDEIRKDEYIQGTVTGLTTAGASAYKVVVYVKTDVWYIHPLAEGGAGESWAPIGPNGSWKISTERREVPASRIAALLVEKDAEVPSKVSNIQKIPHQAIVIHELKGTPDYGKL